MSNKTRGKLCVVIVQVVCCCLGDAEEGFGFPALPRGFPAPLRMQGFAQEQISSAAATGTGSSCMGKGKEGKERRACQLRAAEKVFHSSYLQPSKELQRLPIKTLLKHF